MARFETGYVTSTSPLRVVTLLDTDHPMPAETLDTYTPTQGDRVQLRLRTPDVPLIQGRVST